MILQRLPLLLLLLEDDYWKALGVAVDDIHF